MSAPPTDPIQFACLPGGLIVVKVQGRATHLEAPALRFVHQQTTQANSKTQYIVDLDQCTTMDSTFMGTLASMGISQREKTGTKLIVLNIGEHVLYLLNTLGLKFILDLRQSSRSDVATPEVQFTPAKSPQITPLERTVMMIEAHEKLVDIEGNNEVKFEGVLKSLRESLARQQRP
jgi:anti-sigma B factor antagonist